MNLPRFHSDDGSGLPVLFCHAFPLNAAMWAGQRDGVPGMRAVTFDLPGFGGGGPARPGMSLDDAADMALALADHLGIDRFAAAGCSMGGYIVMSLMRKAPERLIGIVLANTRHGADSEEGRSGRLTQAREVREGGTAALVESMLPKLVSPASLAEQPGLGAAVRSMMDQASPEGIATMLEAMAARPDSTATLQGFDRPACVITGSDDALIPPSAARDMSELLPQASHHVLPGRGHLCCLEAPNAFNGILSDFLSRLPGGD